MAYCKSSLCLWFLAGLFWFLVLLSYLSEPFIVEAVCDSSKDCQFNSGLALERAPYLTPKDFKITILEKVNTASSGHKVKFLPPLTESNGRLTDKAQYVYNPQQWEIDGSWPESSQWGGGGFVGVKPGGTLSWEGASSNLVLDFETSPEAGIVKIESNGADSVEIDLYSPIVGSKQHQISTSFKKYIGRFYGDMSLSPQGDTRLSYINVYFRNRLVHSVNKDFTVSTTSRLRFFGEFILDLVHNLLRLSIFPALCILIGFGLLSSLASISSKIEYLTLSWLCGFCLLTVLVTSLTYSTPILTSVCYIAPCLLLISGLFAKRSQAYTRFKNADLGIDNQFFWPLLLGILGGVSFSHIRTFLEPGWDIGYSLTDSVDYIAWAEMLIHSSLHTANISPWRLADLVSLSLSSIFMGVNSLTAYSLSATSFSILFALIVFCILRYLSVGTIVSNVGAILASSLSVSYVLFSQSYYAQFITVVIILGSIFVGAKFTEAVAKNSLTSGDYICTASVFALLASMYPYVCFPPVILGLFIIVLAIKNGQFHYLKPLGILVLLSVLLININFRILLEFSGKTEHFDFLNLLAKSFLYPYYDSVRMLYMMLGFRDFANLDSRLFNNVAFESIGFIGDLYNMDRFTFGLLVCVVIFICTGFYRLIRSKSVGFRYIAACVFLYVLVTFLLYFDDQVYSFGKYSFIVGILMPVLFLVGVDRIRSKRVGSIFGGIVLVLVLVFNVLSIETDHKLFRYPRSSSVARNAPSHISTISPLLVSLDSAISELAPSSMGQPVSIIGNLSEFSGTDRERVFYNRLLYIFRAWPILDASPFTIPHYQGFYIGRECITYKEKGIYVVFKGYEKCFNLPQLLESGGSKISENEYLTVVEI